MPSASSWAMIGAHIIERIRKFITLCAMENRWSPIASALRTATRLPIAFWTMERLTVIASG